MAHKRKHHRRRTTKGYGRRRGSFGLSIPNLNTAVPAKSAGAGVFLGLVAAGAVSFGINKYNDKQGQKQNGQPLNPTLTLWAPAIAGVAVGGAAFAAMKKKSPGQALALLIGAATGGFIISAFKYAQRTWPAAFGDLVKVRIQGLGNVLINQGALGNLTVRTGQGPGGRLSPGAKASRLQGISDAIAQGGAGRTFANYLRVARS